MYRTVIVLLSRPPSGACRDKSEGPAIFDISFLVSALFDLHLPKYMILCIKNICDMYDNSRMNIFQKLFCKCNRINSLSSEHL